MLGPSFREIQDVQEDQVLRVNPAMLETWVPPEPVAHVAPKEPSEPQDAEV